MQSLGRETCEGKKYLKDWSLLPLLSFLFLLLARQSEHYRGRYTEMPACLLCFLFPPTKNKKQNKQKHFVFYTFFSLSLPHMASQVSDPFNISCSRFYNTFCLGFFFPCCFSNMSTFCCSF